MRNLKPVLFGLFFAVIFLSAWLYAAPVYAADPVCPGDGTQGVAGRIVFCMKGAFANAANYYIHNLYGFLKDAITAAMVFAVVIYGLWTMARGALDLKATWTLVFKIAVVIYFVDHTDEFLLTLIDGGQDLIDMVSRAAFEGANLTCNVALDVQGHVWNRVDCVLGKLIGAAPGVTIKAGIIGFVVKLLFSQAFGAFLFCMGLALILTLIFAVARCVQIFLNAMAAITIIVMLTPLIMPMLLFGPTKKMFDGTIKMLFGFLLQLIFLPLYLVFMLITADTVLFTGPESLYYVIAGPASQNPGFSMSDYMKSNNVFTDELKFNWIMDMEPKAKDDGSKPVEDTEYSGVMGMLPKIGQDALTLIASHVHFGVPFEVVDFQQLANARGVSAGDMFRNLALTFMSTVLIMFIMEGILKYIPDLAFEIGGGAYESVNLSITAAVPGHEQTAALLNSIERRMAK